ncbi:MAG: hypothetical protein AABZ63_01940, partial [Actinomycetota bacterium]
GAVGDGSGTNVLMPTAISSGAKWKAVVGPSFNSFGIQTDGTIWGWGHDLIAVSKVHLLTPVQLDPGTNWVTLAAGDFAVFAIRADETLWVCGQNLPRFAPGASARVSPNMMQLGTDADWREVHAGNGYFIARKKDGSWWGCGENRHGQLGLGSTSHHPVPMPERLPLRFEPWAFTTSIGGTSALLGKDGSLWSWGIRVGEPARMPLLDQLRHHWARMTSSGRGFSFSHGSDYVHDMRPRFLWEPPASVKAALGTNAPSSPKSVP